ncbi:hypothetical protein DFH94DRAFT_709273 [Russula ochroleuca]|uniref:Secreted protein n=1 Tax=Russula ochroleuca TaxID=152965 RepID=A0A9P5N4E7_9AGAM|nr:hypothetical protein DFH94DRAFT_709273 [Russula ochroleuca]
MTSYLFVPVFTMATAVVVPVVPVQPPAVQLVIPVARFTRVTPTATLFWPNPQCRMSNRQTSFMPTTAEHRFSQDKRYR